MTIGNQTVAFEHSLREKWREIPATRHRRMFSSDLLTVGDDVLLEFWERCREETCVPGVRGWYQELYKEKLNGKAVADIGPGLGIDGIWFAQHGARVTFVEIVEDNLELLRRLCRLKGIDADFYYIDDLFEYRFESRFDCFLCVGSLINAPFDFTQCQVKALAPFLHVGGSTLMLGYPKERFDASGAADGASFAAMTDGPRTPWIEWYDDEKIRTLFGSAFQLQWSRKFGSDGIEFNWFDLSKLDDGHPDLELSHRTSIDRSRPRGSTALPLDVVPDR